ncbi:WD40 repeat domain-containing protein, partial [Nonomuraea sp. NPDC005650]|uniref:WD40 repeat domain-containing protein n=1 Tax=Nonomuraea sp. NPDC005650 TaxID=3157045 RepID=UPI0033ACEA72
MLVPIMSSSASRPATPSPEPDGSAALVVLRERLRGAYLHDGEPSLREIERRLGKALSHTTAGAVLRCVKLPRWGQLELVVEALKADRETFHQLWLAARTATPAGASPGQDEEPSPSGLRADGSIGTSHGQLIGELFTEHTDAVLAIAFHPDGHLLATASADAMARLWDPATGQQLGEPLTGHTRIVRAIAFHPDGHLLATAGYKTVRLWNLATGQQLGDSLTGHTDTVNAIFFHPDGRLLATAGYKTVRLWNLATGQQLGEPLTGHTDTINAIAFHPNGHLLATASADAMVRLWDPATGQQLGEPLTGHTGLINAIAFHPDGHLLATAGYKTVRLWNPATGQQLGEPLTGHTDTINAIAFHPNDHLLATASADKTVRLWELAAEHRPGHEYLYKQIKRLRSRLAALRRERDELTVRLGTPRPPAIGGDVQAPEMSGDGAIAVEGADHPATLTARSNLTRFTGKAGDAAAARDQYAALLPIEERVQGPDHPDTLTTRHNLAYWTGKAGDAAAARDQYAALLPIRERVQGPDHPDTLTTR